LADLVGSGKRLAFAFYHIIAPTLHWVGAQWAADELDVYQEHRATEAIRALLSSAQDLVALPDDNAASSLSCALGPDMYSLAPQMAALIAREAGMRSIQLGPNTPAPNIKSAISALAPALVTISISHVANENDTVAALRGIHAHCREHGTFLALGGRALHAKLRKQVEADFFGDTMEHLSGFAARLSRSAGPGDMG